MAFFSKKNITTSLLIGCLVLLIGYYFMRFPSIVTNRWKQNYPYCLSVNTINPTEIYLDDDNVSHVKKPNPIQINLDKAPVTIKEGQKDIDQYIKMRPTIRGSWAYDGKFLIFTPTKDWLPKQEYTITLSKELFEKNTKIKNYTLKTHTLANSISIEKFEVFHNAQRLGQFGLSAQVKSAYPMDDATVFKLKINRRDTVSQVKYDAYKRYAFITFDNLTLKNEQQSATLEGKLSNGYKVSGAVTISAISDFAKLKDVTTEILGQGKNASQVLFLEFADAFDSKRVQDKLHVYLLPQKDPTGNEWNSTTLKDKKYIEEALKKAERLLLTPISQDKDKLVASFKYEAPSFSGKRYVFVQLDSGLISDSGLIIKDSYGGFLPVAQFQKELDFVGDGNIVAASGNKTLNIFSRGIDEISVRVSKIRPTLLNVLLTQTYSLDNWHFRDSQYRGHIQDEDISTIYQDKIYVPDTFNLTYSHLPLNKYLKNLDIGLFFVEIKDSDDKDEEYSRYWWENENNFQKRLILVTDIGLLYKEDISNNIHVYAVSTKTGKPLANTKIDMLVRNGTVQATKHTDANGEAVFSNVTKYTNENLPIAFVATKGQDTSYIQIKKEARRVDYSKNAIQGKHISYYQNEGLDIFIFTDRSLYRPGEEVPFAVVAKNSTWSTTAGLPIKIKITDSQDNTVFEKDVSLTREGLSDFHYVISELAPTGTYRITVYQFKEDDHLKAISEAEFDVRVFKEDNLRVETKLIGADNKGWTSLQGIRGQVSVNNLYGLPAQNNLVKAKISLDPNTFWFKEYATYTFSDYISNKKSTIASVNETLASQTTSVEGLASFPIDLSSIKAGTYKLNFLAEAFEQEGGASVKALSRKLISPNPYIIGYKTQARLNFIPKDWIWYKKWDSK